jgi:hypothetical protein
MRRLTSLPEEHVLALREQVARVESRVDDFFVAVVVRALLDEQDFKVAVGFCEAAGYYATC